MQSHKPNIIPINWGKRINSTGGGSVAEYNLYKFVISAGFKALRESIDDNAWLARGCAADPLRPIIMAVTLWPLSDDKVFDDIIIPFEKMT